LRLTLNRLFLQNILQNNEKKPVQNGL